MLALHDDILDSDEDLDYEEIPVEAFMDDSDSENDESLEKAVRNMNEKTFSCILYSYRHGYF
jgi:hypothetical protein